MADNKRKVAIVTGSATGVGAAAAIMLAERNCNVVINYSSKQQAAEEVADTCRRHGVEVLVSGADVARDDQCRELVKMAQDRWGRLDALVNNAGTTKFVDHSNLEGLSAEDFQRIYAVNVIGAYQMTRAANAVMQQQDSGGSIVNVASTAAINGIGSSIAYAASKGALVTMTLSLARVLGPRVRVNAICPGFIEGDWLRKGMGDQRYEAVMKSNRDSAPLGVNATPETVAEAILHFIAGPSVVTGETLIVDGGRHLNQVPLVRR